MTLGFWLKGTSKQLMLPSKKIYEDVLCHVDYLREAFGAFFAASRTDLAGVVLSFSE